MVRKELELGSTKGLDLAWQRGRKGQPKKGVSLNRGNKVRGGGAVGMHTGWWGGGRHGAN